MAASILLGSTGNGGGNPAAAPAPAPSPAAEPPSPLKPLEELTEADIRQLTREDCRRYLKERGMRRPSWNKAQAIQQVLSLKSLMCSPPNPVVSSSKGPAANVLRADLAAADAPSGKPFADKVSQQSMPDSSPSNNASDTRPLPGCSVPIFPALSSDPKLNPTSSRTVSPHRAQLTIFYSGIVNVYDDVPLDKAQAIMLLAAGKTFHTPATSQPINLPMQQHQQQEQEQQQYQQQQQQQQHQQEITERTHQIQQQHTAIENHVSKLSYQSPAPAFREESSADSGLPQVRSASLQRFLAKRRDRLSGNPRRNGRPKKRKLPSPLPLTSLQFLTSPAPSTSTSTSTATAAATTTTTTTTTTMTSANPTRFKQPSENSNASDSSDTSGGNSQTMDTRDDDSGQIPGSGLAAT